MDKLIFLIILDVWDLTFKFKSGKKQYIGRTTLSLMAKFWKIRGALQMRNKCGNPLGGWMVVRT